MPYHSPTNSQPAVFRTALSLACLVSPLLISACESSFITSDLREEVPLEVTHTDPAEAEQGDTLTVHIFGEGFTEGDVVSWEKDGVPITLIVVDNVSFVSRTRLVARIRIGLDTDIGRYDVAVTRKRKKGVGSEARAVAAEVFEVKRYTPTALGWVPSIIEGYGFTYLHIEDLNDQGVVVGRDGCCAFRWSENEGMLQFGSTYSWAMSINNEGWIVGFQASGSGETYRTTPFIFENGVVTDLPTRADASGEASAINDAGTIAGSANGMPVVWRRDAEGGYGDPVHLSLPFDELPGQSNLVSGLAINGRGDIAGTLHLTRGIGTFWRARSDGTYEDPIVLDDYGAGAQVESINDAGWIVGMLDPPTNGEPPVAVVWHPDNYSRTIPLGWPTSGGAYAYDINNDFQVVGLRMGQEFKPSIPFPGGDNQATLWQLDSAGRTYHVTPLLPLSDYSDSWASAINADGLIVGRSAVVTNNSWEERATIWRPDR